jgi:adenine-specific DNA-methyltransferase
MVFYSCEKCGKQFNQKGHYNKHIHKKLPCINETKLKEIISVVVNEQLNEINNKKKIDLFISKDLEDTINTEIPIMTTKNNLGQYFTTHIELKEKIFEFILNNPCNILEPSIGQGDLITFITDKIPSITFDMYEIDKKIKLLETIQKDNVIYGDFMKQIITKTYKTIIGNPPYIRTKKGNLYIDFIEKCYHLLDDNGELIFIVPSDFLKLTSASKLLNIMMKNGTFTHIFHPHNEKMFENASIDVIVFRYCKNNLIEKKVFYNNVLLYITNSNGLITFGKEENKNSVMFQDYFDIYVGLVSGKEEVYKNEELGNIKVLNGEDKVDKYIYIEKYPCENEKINEHLLHYKKELIKRGIRKFNEKNWFEWGAPRNINNILKNIGKDCIYIYNLTRKSNVAFLDKVQYFGGSLIMLKPKTECNLNNIISYINSNTFKDNFMFSGRFKIGHRSLSNSFIPNEYL